jgi:hypothetical protein
MAQQSDAFKIFLNAIPKEHGEIATNLHRLILHIHPRAHESVWHRQNIASYGVGPKKMSEHFVYIANYRDHVNLGFYQGASMEDPAQLLAGTGTDLRHIKIKTLADAKSENLTRYIEEALRLRRAAQVLTV